MEITDQSVSFPSVTSDNKWSDVVGTSGTSCNYTALPSGNFLRIVDLLPASDLAAPIVCVTRIQEITQAATQGYEALSYVWGTAQDSMQISLDDLEAIVRQNLYSALQHLRLHTEPRRLWIDAICIDQWNTLERNHQVGMMCDIFSVTSRVIAWWGPELDTTQRIFDCFAQSPTKVHYRTLSMYQADVAAVPTLAYWSRVWIVQEIVVAREITIQWGPYTLAWADFTKKLRRDKSYAMILKTIGLRDYDSRQRNLVNLLYATEVTQCTDPRDKVFALLGLINNDLSEPMAADYSMSPCMVYCKAIRTIYKEACLTFHNQSPLSEYYCHSRLSYPETHPAAGDCDGSSCGRRRYCLNILPWKMIRQRKGENESWPKFLSESDRGPKYLRN
jgi:hypothetical protein